MQILCKVFHGGRHVAGKDLPCIMINGQHGAMLRITGFMKNFFTDHCKSVGNHDGLQGMLRVIFRKGIPHKSPALYIFHSCKVRKKSVHIISPVFRKTRNDEPGRCPVRWFRLLLLR